MSYEDTPYVCPSCYAVAGERCAPGCIQAEMDAEAEYERDYGPFDDDTDDDD